MSILGWLGAVVGILALTLVAAMGWQHARYLHARRQIVQDRQPLFYGASTLHVVTLLAVRDGQDVADEVERFQAAVESAGARMVYAGKTVLQPLSSPQIPDLGWDAVVVTQFDDRTSYERLTGSPGYQKTLGDFEGHYSIGMDRSVLANLAIPQVLLGVRVLDLVRGVPARYPFEQVDPDLAAAADAATRQRYAEVMAMRQEQELGSEAVLIVNFVKEGNASQQAANAGYGRRMFGLMAEQAHGPMHFGKAITLEGEARFDNLVLVYYPGVDYVAEMLTSKFFTGISGGKQLGDTHVSLTVPLLGRP